MGINNIQTREPFNFIKKDLILYLYQVIKYGKIFIEKFKNENGVPPDEAATSSGKDGRNRLPHDTDFVCDTHMFIIRYIFGFYNYNVLCILDSVC